MGDRKKPEVDAKKLLMTSPKLDSLVRVSQQAVQNLRARETGISIKEPPKKSEQVKEQPPKRHQHPLPSKGVSE